MRINKVIFTRMMNEMGKDPWLLTLCDRFHRLRDKKRNPDTQKKYLFYQFLCDCLDMDKWKEHSTEWELTNEDKENVGRLKKEYSL